MVPILGGVFELGNYRSLQEGFKYECILGVMMMSKLLKNKKISFVSILLMLIFVVFLGGGFKMTSSKRDNSSPEMLKDEDVAKNYYKNPGSISQIGDPFVLKAPDGKYYCYPTSADNGFKVWSSKDLVNWTPLGLAYQALDKSWGYKDFWAPEVVHYKGKYYMYYTARWSKNDSLRLGVAVSSSPKGPFKDVLNKPLFDLGYAAIDGNVLIDSNGKKYLYFSKDCSENIVKGKHVSQIFGVRLNDNMTGVVGKPVLISTPEQKWETVSGPDWLWNEGPTVLKHNNIYYLMYSANFYSSENYSIGYATSKSPLGPFKKSPDNPLVSAQMNYDQISGPGHNSITVSPDGKENIIVYHTHTDVFSKGGDRQINIDRYGFRSDGSMYVNGPTISSQLMPSSMGGIVNIAPMSKLNVSSVSDGYSKEALTDGEIGIYPWLEKYEYLSAADDKTPTIEFSWDKTQTIKGVMIYGSSVKERNNSTWKLLFSNGMEIDNIIIPGRSAEAAIFNFKAIDVDWIKLCSDGKTDDNATGLSEIMVLK